MYVTARGSDDRTIATPTANRRKGKIINFFSNEWNSLIVYSNIDEIGSSKIITYIFPPTYFIVYAICYQTSVVYRNEFFLSVI